MKAILDSAIIVDIVDSAERQNNGTIKIIKGEAECFYCENLEIAEIDAIPEGFKYRAFMFDENSNIVANPDYVEFKTTEQQIIDLKQENIILKEQLQTTKDAVDFLLLNIPL